MVKKYIIRIFLLFIFLTSTILPLMAQVSTYRYFSGPGGSYEFRSNAQGFAVPNGNFQYYNGSPQDMNRMLERFNQLMDQYMQGNTFNNDPFFNNNNFGLNPTIPNFNTPQNNNLYAPNTQGLEPAPNFKDNPDIYY